MKGDKTKIVRSLLQKTISKTWFFILPNFEAKIEMNFNNPSAKIIKYTLQYNKIINNLAVDKQCDFYWKYNLPNYCKEST